MVQWITCLDNYQKLIWMIIWYFKRLVFSFRFFSIVFIKKKLNQRHICDEAGFVKWRQFFIYYHYNFSMYVVFFFGVNDLNFNLSVLCTWILLWGGVKNCRKWRMLNTSVCKIRIWFGIPKLFYVIIIVHQLWKYLMLCPFQNSLSIVEVPYDMPISK